MLNFSPELADPEHLRRNQRAVERHITDDHYVRRFGPGDFVVDGTGLHVILATGGSNVWPAVEMPDGVTTRAAVTFGKPSEWRSGKLRLKYWYTSPLGSTNPFDIAIAVRASRTGEALPATLLLSLALTNPPGPAVAFTQLDSGWIYTTTSFGSDDELIAIRIARMGGDVSDTHADDFELLYLRVEHIPAVRESQ